ncbi:MAG TPA: PspC domain-containing protein [Candidatus Limnocylindria bacterium]|nr:PspC domain-containing protein [Candidatus Limnocylindria bacterium]
MNRRLYRSRRDSVLGGVAGGVADYFDMDPSIVRVVWAVLALVTGGIFLVLYVVMWIVVPEGPSAATVARAAAEDASAIPPGAAGEPGTGALPVASVSDTSASDTSASDTSAPDTSAPDTSAPDWATREQQLRRRGSGGAVVFGVILIAAGFWFLVDQYLPDIDTDLLWPVALVVLGVVLLVIALRRPSSQ